jgi:hypothetical protein
VGPLPRIFESLSSAEQAREALLAAGFARDKVALIARHDEAGPVEGNFLVGNIREGTVNRTRFLPTAGGKGHNTYGHNFARTVDRGVFMLTVDADDDEQLARASRIMATYGAVNVDDLVPPGRSSGCI